MKNKIIIFLALLLLSGFAVYPQAKKSIKKDTLLCFIGMWKSRTVFKADSNYITGGAAGSTITIGPDGSTTVQSPDGQQLNQQIDNGTASANTMETNLDQKLTNAEGFNEYHLYNYVKDDVDSTKEFFKDLKVPTGPPANSPSNSPASNFANVLAQGCRANQGDYSTIIQFWQAHKGIRNEHYDYLPPPQADYFNCWGCNRAGQKEFEKQCKLYDSTFFEPESGMLRKALALMRQLALLGKSSDVSVSMDDPLSQAIDNLFKKDRNNPSQNGPCAYLDNTDLTSAVEFLVQRMEKKAHQLLDDVNTQNNYNSFSPAIRVELRALRLAILVLGSTAESNQSEDAVLDKCRTLTKKLLDKLTDAAVNQHDYTYLPDIPFMFALETQLQLMGGGTDGEDQFIDQMLSLTKYTISLDMNVKTNVAGIGGAAAHLSGTAKIVLELDSVNCINFILSKQEKGVITMNLLENTMTASQCQPTYIGTKTYSTQLPGLIIHFCKTGPDSLKLTRFVSKPMNTGTWKDPCSPVPVANDINGLDGFFYSRANIQQREQAFKANETANKQQQMEMIAKLKQQAEQMKQQLQQGGAGGMTSTTTAVNIKDMMDMNNAMRNGRQQDLNRLIIVVTVKNNSTTLIDQTINARDVNPGSPLNQTIAYGTLHIQLKNTPAN